MGDTIKKKLFIALPIYGAVDSHFFKAHSKLIAESMGLDMVIYPHVGDSLIPRARNACTRLFLESDCTHLLWIDSDLVFSDSHIKRILSHDLDLIGGVYCKKQEGPPQIVANCMLTPCPPNANDVVEVRYVGTGFMCISRRVFETMIEKFHDEMWYTLDHDRKKKEYDFWHVGHYQYPDGSRRYLSEDWWFCQKWMDCGEKVYMDLRCVLKHSGNAVYPLSYQEEQLFQRAPGPVPVAAAPVENCAGDSSVASPTPADPAQPVLSPSRAIDLLTIPTT